MKHAWKVLLVALAFLIAVTGCSKKEEPKTSDGVASHGQTARKESVVVVPDNVKGKWKAVKIAVRNKATNKETIYTVAIGSQVAIPGSDLIIKVENFLPQFVINGTALTSLSNEPKNPAAQIRIMEGGKEIWKGWLFSLYPVQHAFQHPKYGFTLVDFVPAG